MTTETGTLLYVDAIDVKPVNFDWGERYGERWETVTPDVSDWTPAQCYRWLRDQGYADSMGDVPELSGVERGDVLEIYERWRAAVRDGMDQSDGFAPMMNYYYPIPERTLRGSQRPAEAMQTAILGTGACAVVLVDDEPVLALAGGGMDLPWDICRAYIALGYYSPVHFAGDLPRQGERDVRTAELALESCRIAAGWATRHVEDAERLLAETRAIAERGDR
jgi:hypothetical protein